MLSDPEAFVAEFFGPLGKAHGARHRIGVGRAESAPCQIQDSKRYGQLIRFSGHNPE